MKQANHSDGLCPSSQNIDFTTLLIVRCCAGEERTCLRLYSSCYEALKCLTLCGRPPRQTWLKLQTNGHGKSRSVPSLYW